MKQEDKDKRRFLYVVAIEMHEKGLLDGALTSRWEKDSPTPR